jgi:hypothetical protein
MNKSTRYSPEVRERAVRLADAGSDPSVGNVPPAEKEIEYYQQLEGSAMAA